MSINYSNYEFTDPISANNWYPLPQAGIYAVQIYSVYVKPRIYRVIYFGQTHDFAERGIIDSHHKLDCFLRNAGTIDGIYISTYAMPNSTEYQRKTIESQLIREWKPECNDQI